ncbi:MAG: hypothetical protein NWF14_02335 [Candidatus Bathyarchaeota archaeon]|nr:hypothetical protein [Candidatus Bathyarchaeota archaeon]
MSGNTWQVQPVYVTIIEILEEKGAITDVELFEVLKAFYEKMGFDDLNKTLMRMEVTGLISVSSRVKDRRLVQLMKR